jgi:hypothetical protein
MRQQERTLTEQLDTMRRDFASLQAQLMQQVRLPRRPPRSASRSLAPPPGGNDPTPTPTCSHVIFARPPMYTLPRLLPTLCRRRLTARVHACPRRPHRSTTCRSSNSSHVCVLRLCRNRCRRSGCCRTSPPRLSHHRSQADRSLRQSLHPWCHWVRAQLLLQRTISACPPSLSILLEQTHLGAVRRRMRRMMGR